MSYYTKVTGFIETTKPIDMAILYDAFVEEVEEIKPCVYAINSWEINYFDCPSIRTPVNDIPNVKKGELYCITEEYKDYMLKYNPKTKEWQEIPGEVVYINKDSIKRFFENNPAAVEIARGC